MARGSSSRRVRCSCFPATGVEPGGGGGGAPSTTPVACHCFPKVKAGRRRRRELETPAGFGGRSKGGTAARPAFTLAGIWELGASSEWDLRRRDGPIQLPSSAGSPGSGSSPVASPPAPAARSRCRGAPSFGPSERGKLIPMSRHVPWAGRSSPGAPPRCCGRASPGKAIDEIRPRSSRGARLSLGMLEKWHTVRLDVACSARCWLAAAPSTWDLVFRLKQSRGANRRAGYQNLLAGPPPGLRQPAGRPAVRRRSGSLTVARGTVFRTKRPSSRWQKFVSSLDPFDGRKPPANSLRLGRGRRSTTEVLTRPAQRGSLFPDVPRPTVPFAPTDRRVYSVGGS